MKLDPHKKGRKRSGYGLRKVAEEPELVHQCIGCSEWWTVDTLYLIVYWKENGNRAIEYVCPRCKKSKGKGTRTGDILGRPEKYDYEK